MDCTLDVEGLSFRWHEEGDGVPVVLVHGIPTCPALWRHVVPRLHDARSYAWQMLGYGSSWPQSEACDISVKSQAGYLLRWMDAVGLERAVLVGHDLGGGVVQIAAVQQPERCAGLVLTNAIAYDSWPIPSVKAMHALSPLVERMPTLMFRGVFALFLRQGHDDARMAGESIAVHWANYNHPQGAAAFTAQIRSLRTEDTLEVAPKLGELNLPAVMVWGASDRFQTIDYAWHLARDLSGDVDVIPDGKHFVPEDHPDRIASAIHRVIEHARV